MAKKRDSRQGLVEVVEVFGSKFGIARSTAVINNKLYIYNGSQPPILWDGRTYVGVDFGRVDEVKIKKQNKFSTWLKNKFEV